MSEIYKSKNILIVGGSSGLGLSLAKLYLKQGCRVGVVARTQGSEEMQTLISNPNFEYYRADIRNLPDIRVAIQNFSHKGLDMLFAVAGFYASRRDQILSPNEIEQMIQVNVLGTYNTFVCGRDIMLSTGGGHLVAISSMTALLQYPKATVYSATKRGVLNLCEMFRNGYRDYKIRVTEVIPGYINTERLKYLNATNPSPRPFIMSPEDAAAIISKGLEEGKERIIFPWQMYILVRFISLLPESLQRVLLGLKK